MTVRMSIATGNWLTAGTWAAVDSTSYSNSETANTALTTSYVTSSTFTPGAITIDGIAVKLATRAASPSGTISVALDLATVTVTGTEVTIDVADLPLPLSAAITDGGWILFKFSSSVLLLAATAYGVKVKTSSSSQVNLFSTATTNWSRALRTTTTGAPAAGDDLIVLGEHTGSGTGNSFTVTMDETANTDYGSNTNSTVTPALAICKRGTLTFKDTSAANPYLRLSGCAIVYNGGTLNVGGSTAIPRDSTAVLEFDPAADGDMGLIGRNGGTVNIQGLSRTSGKNIVSCKLNADSSTNLMQAIALSSTALTAAAATTTLDPTGTSLGVGAAVTTFNQLIGSTDTAANSNHKYNWTGASVTNVTQVFTIWVKRGSGTNNRYVRLQLATATALPATNGFYADFDLQAGTVGTCTALGNGTATSAAITAFGGGYICTIIGKISSGAGSSIACIGACNSSGGVSYTGDATQNFICTWPQVYTASSQPTQDTVDTDTGWKSGDVVALASTTRTAAECEVASLASDAGATTLTYNLYPVNARSGTSPTQAEIILLTRNVKIRSTSAQIMAYVNALQGSVWDIDWAEFYYIGQNSSGKFGIDVEVNSSAATNFSMQFSSVHDCEAGGFVLRATSAAGTLTNAVFSSNGLWNLATVTGPSCQTSSAITSTNWTFDSNILIKNGNSNGWTLTDIGGTFTNNTVAGATSSGISLLEPAILGTFSANTIHSNNGVGCTLGAVGISGTITSLMAWRNTSSGFNTSSTVVGLIVDTLTAFGNTTDNVLVSSQGGDIWFKSPVLNGDTTFSTTNGIRTSVGNTGFYLIDNGDFSTVSGIKTAQTNDINVGASPSSCQYTLRNTKLGASTEVATQSNLSSHGFVASQKHDQTAGNHKVWMSYGTLQTDSTFFNTASPSMRMTPNNASNKLESTPQFQGLRIAVANGTTAAVSVYIRKSAAGDGAAYNGNQPRLIQKANPALGQNSDVVLATYSAGTGAWNQISGTTSSATDDGTWEIVVDCDGTAGWINIDDFQGGGGKSNFQYWFNGTPVLDPKLPSFSGGLFI